MRATQNWRVCTEKRRGRGNQGRTCSLFDRTTCPWWTPPWSPLSPWPLTPKLPVNWTPYRTSCPVSDNRSPCWSSTRSRSTGLSVGVTPKLSHDQFDVDLFGLFTACVWQHTLLLFCFFLILRGSEQVSLTVQCFIVSKLYGLWFCFNINILLILIFIVELGNFGKINFLGIGNCSMYQHTFIHRGGGSDFIFFKVDFVDLSVKHIDFNCWFAYRYLHWIDQVYTLFFSCFM